MIVEILSAIRNADIPKNATGDLATTGAPNRPEMLAFRSPGESTRRKAPELRGFFLETGHCPNSGTAWLTPQSSELVSWSKFPANREKNSVCCGKCRRTGIIRHHLMCSFNHLSENFLDTEQPNFFLRAGKFFNCWTDKKDIAGSSFLSAPTYQYSIEIIQCNQRGYSQTLPRRKLMSDKHKIKCARPRLNC